MHSQTGRISLAALPSLGAPAFQTSCSSSSLKTGAKLSSGPLIRLLSKPDCAIGGVGGEKGKVLEDRKRVRVLLADAVTHLLALNTHLIPNGRTRRLR